MNEADAAPEDDAVDVLVLGAGAAGLAAARALAGAGRRVTVLEARERVGGRILTRRTASHPLPIDLGPEFVHGRAPETFGLLAEAGLVAIDMPFHHHDATGRGPPRDSSAGPPGGTQVAAPTAAENGRSGRVPAGEKSNAFGSTGSIGGGADTSHDEGATPDGGPTPDAAGPLVPQDDAPWDAAEELLASMTLANGEDLSFDDWLARQRGVPADVARRARGYVEGFNAAEAGRIGVRSILDSNAEEDAQDGQRQYRLIGGYDQLIDALARGVTVGGGRVRCGVVVRRIAWQANRVEVTCDTAGGQRTFVAKRVVVALPLGVLQQPADAAAGVAFVPELPTRAAIQDKLVMGHVQKIVLHCRRPFWEEWLGLDVSFLHHLDAPIPVWWTQAPMRTSVLVGWAGGGPALALRGDLRRAAVDSLAMLFGKPADAIGREIVSADTHDWSADPFSRGAYSYVAAGGADGPDELAEPIAGTLFFAGEHTHRGLIGTVAGAIRTGRRAAGLILGGDP